MSFATVLKLWFAVAFGGVAFMAVTTSDWANIVRESARASIEADADDPGWQWFGRSGRSVEVELWVDVDLYPNDDGVIFWVQPVDGGFYRDRTDVRGPKQNDVFHATARDVSEGDRYQAEWTDREGVAHTAVFTID